MHKEISAKCVEKQSKVYKICVKPRLLTKNEKKSEKRKIKKIQRNGEELDKKEWMKQREIWKLKD